MEGHSERTKRAIGAVFLATPEPEDKPDEDDEDRFWINIQTAHDLEIERDLHADELAKITALVAR